MHAEELVWNRSMCAWAHHRKFCVSAYVVGEGDRNLFKQLDHLGPPYMVCWFVCKSWSNGTRSFLPNAIRFIHQSCSHSLQNQRKSYLNIQLHIQKYESVWCVDESTCLLEGETIHLCQVLTSSTIMKGYNDRLRVYCYSLYSTAFLNDTSACLALPLG